MSAAPEVDFEVLEAGRYGELREPLLVAARNRNQVADFRTQQGLGELSWVMVGKEGWEGYMGQGKVLLLFPGALLDESIEAAVRRWVDSEEWTWSVPVDDYDLATAEREQDHWLAEHRQRTARWWRRAAGTMATLCAVLCWASTLEASVQVAAWPFFLAATGWVAAALTSGE